MADHETCPDGPASPPPSPGTEGPVAAHKLIPGARVAGIQVGERVPGGPGEAFQGVSVSDMASVILRVQAIAPGTQARRATWEKLLTMPPDRFLTCTDAFEEDGWRYEVIQAPALTTLREWIACHKAGLPLLERLVGQLTEAVAALHEAGVVHLALSPDCIFVQPDAKLDIVIGGLEEATLIDQETISPSQISALYAPPEAFSIHAYQGGPGLRAWDWWSIGRILQEFVLGKHVMSLMFDCDIVREREAYQGRSEALLQEREPPSVRAGAVEVMPDMPLATETLLKGLLTSTKEGRWGPAALRQWLAHKPTPTQYALPTASRLFARGGFGCTALEASEALSSRGNWPEGVSALFGSSGPGPFCEFLRGDPESKAVWADVEACMALMAEPSWADLPTPARQDAVACLVWHRVLSTKPQKQVLQVRGRRLDGDGLTSLASDLEIDHRYALFQALTAEPFRCAVQARDPEAAALLGRLGDHHREAVSLARQRGWLKDGDLERAMVLLKLVLEPEAVRSTKLARLRGAYGGSEDPLLNEVISGKTNAPAAVSLLLFAGAEPEAPGCIPRDEWEERQRLRRKAERERREAARMGRRLRRLFSLERGLLTGSWARCVLPLALLLVAGVALGRTAFAACVVLGFVGFRLLTFLGLHLGLRALSDDHPGLGWNALIRGCSDLPETLSQGVPPDEGSGDATSEPGFSAGALATFVACLPFAGAWGAALWIVVGTTALVVPRARPGAATQATPALASLPGSPHPLPAVAGIPMSAKPALPGVMTLHAAARGAEPIAVSSRPGLPQSVQEKLATGRYELVTDFFGPRLHGPLERWALHPQGPVPPLPVRSILAASPLQGAEALLNADILLDAYARRSVTAYVAVPVPTGNGLGYLIVNGRERTLADTRAFILERTPAVHDWYQLGPRRVVYLGAPSILAEEASVAAPAGTALFRARTTPGRAFDDVALK